MTSYASSKQIFEFLRWNKRIPAFVPGGTPTPEIVDNSGTVATATLYYLDHEKVIDNTLTLSYGSSATATTALIKDTDYTVNLDTGRITLLAPALDKIGTDYIYAEYQFNDLIEDSVISDMIDRSQKWIEEETYQTYGTSYLVNQEEQLGRGVYDMLYRPRNLPVNIAKTQLDTGLQKTYFITDGTAVTATTVVTVVTVGDNSGFRISDILTLGKELMEVTNVVGGTALDVTRGYPTGSANLAVHSMGDWLVNAAMEISNSPKGFPVNFSTLGYRSNFDIDSDTGAVHLLHVNAEDKDDLAPDVYPLLKIPNRIKLTYRYGKDEVPKDLEKATILLVARDLMNSALSKSLPEGRNDFSPTGLDQMDTQIEKLIRKRRLLLSGGF